MAYVDIVVSVDQSMVDKFFNLVNNINILSGGNAVIVKDAGSYDDEIVAVPKNRGAASE
jgi:hypothetical protein